MPLKLKIDVLSKQSIKEAQKQLDEYNNRLSKVNARIVELLAEKGISIAEASVGKYGAYITFQKKVLVSGKLSTTVVANVYAKELTELNIKWQGLNGKIESYNISPLLMAEYGSGHHITDMHEVKNPNAKQGALSDTVGKGHAHESSWGWYDLDGSYHVSTGYTPTIPMYKAFSAMYLSLIHI